MDCFFAKAEPWFLLVQGAASETRLWIKTHLFHVYLSNSDLHNRAFAVTPTKLATLPDIFSNLHSF